MTFFLTVGTEQLKKAGTCPALGTLTHKFEKIAPIQNKNILCGPVHLGRGRKGKGGTNIGSGI